MSESNSPERRIIIDEDWKSQVEQEREQLKSRTDPEQSDEAPEATSSTGQQLPPASIDLLITTLATQTLACLGQIPDPLEHKAVVRLDLARHHIDMLDVLQEKTKGNLTADEAASLEAVIHQLRMVYVSVSNQTAP